MRALVVSESLFGNTGQVAQAVAKGIQDACGTPNVRCVSVDDADAAPRDLDLVVVGGPTHFWGMSSRVSRAMESQYERRLAQRRGPVGGAPRDALSTRHALSTRGVRAWLRGQRSGVGVFAAAFDTREDRALAGGAARGIARRLSRHRFRLVAAPTGFVVDGVAGPLRAGEAARARAWGRALARAATAASDHDGGRHGALTVTRGRSMIMNGVHNHNTADSNVLMGDAFSPPVVQGDAAVITATDTRGRVLRSRALGVELVLSRRRPVGAFAVRQDQSRWRPALDVTRVITTAEVVVGAVLVAQRLARRPGAAKALVTMGPGGWVSMKGGAVAVRPGRRFWARPRPLPTTAPGTRTPLWARVLSAVPLQRLVG